MKTNLPFYLVAFALPFTAQAAVKPQPLGLPEKEALKLSQILKPIPDAKWAEIAGPKISEKYEINKGDTLFDISKRLFGDPRYWPKIWALNNPAITNPHFIRPGKMIAFLSGSGTSLPSVQEGDVGSSSGSVGESLSDAAAPITENAQLKSDEIYFPQIEEEAQSEEWKKVPQEMWKETEVRLPDWLDTKALNKSDKLRLADLSYDLEAIVLSERVDPQGEVTGGKTENSNLSLHDLVFVKSFGNIQVGETYSIASEPYVLSESPDSARKGYSYTLHGRVKILGVRDEVFIGQIVSSSVPLPRGSLLIPNQPKVKIPAPITGPSRIDAQLFLDHTSSTYAAAQQKQVFIDRGSDDGIQPGMVFRAFQHTDPNTKQVMTDAQAVALGDIIVMQVSQKFSAGIITSGTGILQERIPLTLLTEMSDINLRPGVMDSAISGRRNERTISNPSDVDTLERIEAGGSLGRKEEKDLQQLETYSGEDKNKAGGALPSDSSLAAPPTEELPSPEGLGDLPPPPADDAAPLPDAPLPDAPLPDAPLPEAPAPDGLQEPSLNPDTSAPPTAPVEELPPPPADDLIPGM